MQGIGFSTCGNFFLANCSDRVIRTFSTKSPLEVLKETTEKEDGSEQSKDRNAIPVMPVLAEFQNVVDRMQWRSACFSANGDYIVGAAALKAEHHIYLWDRLNKRLVKTLEVLRMLFRFYWGDRLTFYGYRGRRRALPMLHGILQEQ